MNGQKRNGYRVKYPWVQGSKLIKEVGPMKTKKLIVLLMVAAFTFGMVGLGFSAQEVKGTVSKIEGIQLTIQDEMGKQTTVKVEDPADLKDLQIGDKVLVKDGKVTKEGK